MQRTLHVQAAIVVLCCVAALAQVGRLPASPEDSQTKTDASSPRESERVRLSEIMISTPQPYDPAQVDEARHKAEQIRDAIRQGGAFANFARTNSQGPTAILGGDIGYFKRGSLAPSLDELVWRMKVGDVSDVLRTKQGFVILKVTERALPQGSQIQEAARAARQGGGQQGELGAGNVTHGRQQGSLDILSDTQGVDFGPYLQRILHEVKENWYLLIPESISKKKGKLAIEFAITKEGHVAGMKLVASAGDVMLDRAAWGSITNSTPFPPLPSEFQGQYLALRLRFYYNPDKSDLPDNKTVAASPSKSTVEISIEPAGLLEVPAGGSTVITTTVTGTKDDAVDWSLTGTGCSGSACGEMKKNLYTAPSILPNPALVTLTATLKADPNARASTTIHIVQPSLSH
jgi:TonB family protein